MNLKDQQLVTDAFDGELDEAGFRNLQDRLREEPELLKFYRDHARLHHSLAEEFEAGVGAQMAAPAGGARSVGGIHFLTITGLIVVGISMWMMPDRWPHRGRSEAAAAGKESRSEHIESAPQLTTMQLLLDDAFDRDEAFDGSRPQVGASHWRLERGNPQMSGGVLEGSDFEAYFYLPGDQHTAESPVLIVTVTMVKTSMAPLHTDGWSGVSLYQDGYEACFFGDCYGPEETWSLDVKRRLPPIPAAPKVAGPRTMTLCYDRRDGVVELFDGDEPDAEERVASSKLQPGLSFDQIRIGASEGAGLAISNLKVWTMRVEDRER